MIPSFCRVKHDPKSNCYGDCLRACIASILDIENPETVPHFAQTGDIDFDLMRQWLGERDLAPCFTIYPGDIQLDELLDIYNDHNKDFHYILFARNPNGGDHAYVMYNKEKVHDPGWHQTYPHSPNSSGHWIILTLVKK